MAARLRAALADPARAADDADIPRLYTLLVEAGEADLEAHLAMVRFAVATGQLERARSLAEAVTTLFPAAREAWEALARVARAQGDGGARGGGRCRGCRSRRAGAALRSDRKGDGVSGRWKAMGGGAGPRRGAVVDALFASPRRNPMDH